MPADNDLAAFIGLSYSDILLVYKSPESNEFVIFLLSQVTAAGNGGGSNTVHKILLELVNKVRPL